MLELLHEKINNIVNILGIGEKDDGSYNIEYIDTPNENQLTEINNVIEQWPLEKEKIKKIKELDDQWNKALSQGWTTPYGWKLGLTMQDVVLLNGNFMLAKEMINNNINNTIFIIDTNNEPHELSLQDLTTLMLQYGQARAALSSLYSTILKTIKESTSIDQVNNTVTTIA